VLLPVCESLWDDVTVNDSALKEKYRPSSPKARSHIKSDTAMPKGGAGKAVFHEPTTEARLRHEGGIQFANQPTYRTRSWAFISPLQPSGVLMVFGCFSKLRSALHTIDLWSDWYNQKVEVDGESDCVSELLFVVGGVLSSCR
jgi:hypothetical protein